MSFVAPTTIPQLRLGPGVVFSARMRAKGPRVGTGATREQVSEPSGPKAHASFQIASIDEIAILGNSLGCKSRPSLVAKYINPYLRKREVQP